MMAVPGCILLFVGWLVWKYCARPPQPPWFIVLFPLSTYDETLKIQCIHFKTDLVGKAHALAGSIPKCSLFNHLKCIYIYIIYIYIPGWWSGTFFIFPNSWDDDPIRLICFRGVETTNWIMCADFSDSGFHHYTSISPSCLFQSQRAGRSQIDSLKPWRLGKPTGWLLWYCRMLVIWIRHVQYWPWLESSSINRKYPTYIMWNYILVSIHICKKHL